jgi:hypothetical protein
MTAGYGFAMRVRHGFAVLMLALILVAAAGYDVAARTSPSSSHVLTFQQEHSAPCGSSGAVKSYSAPRLCVRLSRVVLGPGAFVLARRLRAGAMGTAGGTPPGPWVEVVISDNAKVVMQQAVTAAFKDGTGSPPFDFAFDGHPLPGDLGGDGVTVFLLAPDARTARSIVALVCHAGCNKPFPGPTG